MPTPEREEELRLHVRLTDGDPIASAEIAEAYGDALVDALRRSTRRPDDELHDAAIDAMMKLFSRPEIYDPAKGLLLSFLITVAKRGLIDGLRSRRREKKRGTDYGTLVELPRGVPFNLPEMKSDVQKVMPYLSEAISAEDWPALELIVLDGERSTEVLAHAWSLPATLSVEERQAEVKRRRDRLMKTLERVGRKINEDNS